MQNSTTSADEGLKRVKLSDSEWVTCDECGFEYPPIVDRCPECFPPSIPARHTPQKDDAEALGPLVDDEVLEVMEVAGVNVHSYQHATLEGFNPNPDKVAADRAHEFIIDWRATLNARWPSRDWMYLYGHGSAVGRGVVEIGKLGNGKTHLGIAIARELITRRLLHPKQYRFVTAEALLLEMEATFRSQATDSEFELLRRYEGLDLLHIDDFGVREPSPHAVRVLDELTKRREGKATIWTSNLSLKVVAEQQETLQRIVSRIAGACGEGARFVVPFQGPDRRLERSKKGRTK